MLAFLSWRLLCTVAEGKFQAKHCHRALAHAQDVALEFRGADFDWKHTGWQRSAANRSLSAVAAHSPIPEVDPRGGADAFRRQRRKRCAIVDAESPPETPLEPLLKGLRCSVRKGELLGICGEVRCFCALAGVAHADHLRAPDDQHHFLVLFGALSARVIDQFLL